ncbi:hypothetical protein chiPu_0022284 [Chiloscyllium punctatum]|uniref:Uncharacterized protein n=1 Tax=Chiloscyllium punctatum TaxID=137246 RepID=A0A401RGZ5_CHIPU|nr:hypothetical protein [Chiloscyllium punctatum]
MRVRDLRFTVHFKRAGIQEQRGSTRLWPGRVWNVPCLRPASSAGVFCRTLTRTIPEVETLSHEEWRKTLGQHLTEG